MLVFGDETKEDMMGFEDWVQLALQETVSDPRVQEN